MNTIIEKKPDELFKSLCVLAAQKSWGEARDAAEQLANRGAQGAWLDLAFDLADGLKSLYQVTDDLFSLGERSLSDTEIKTIEYARKWVGTQLNISAPTLIIEICAEGTPLHAITGINGFGFIAASENALQDKSLLVHEITHCSLMSRSLFLDEGLATLLQHRFNENEEFLQKQKYWDRPSLAALVETDWSNDPYFSKIIPTKSDSSDLSDQDLRVHELAAHLIAKIIKEKSLSFLVNNWASLKSQLREGRSAVVMKEIFSVDLWKIDTEFFVTKAAIINPPSDRSLTDVSVQVLAEEDKETAAIWLPFARVQAYRNDEGLVALIKLLIVLGNNREDPNAGSVYRSEALVAIDWSKSRNIDQMSIAIFNAYIYVLKLRSAGHAIAMRTNGIEAHKAFRELLSNYPENPSVIIASARTQIRSIHDFMPISDWREKLKNLHSDPLFSRAVEELLAHSRFL
ncbi:hypothetical protein [Aquimarina aggregata]|uniref:hypothetical protein n=1 Tax=Aquimarina aggregata TaxID=1642818 RepID=UPI002492D14F|nr:hypothetical protein [Aquimarina aggregata]